MSQPASNDVGAFLALYDVTLPRIYGYLLARCGARQLAEELTAETYLAAVDAARRPLPPLLSEAWLIGTARHKLADHWRAKAREERGLRAVAAQPAAEAATADPLDALQARAALAGLAPQYRCALVLRYVDDLPVAAVAAEMGRSLHATEAVLARARAAFRIAYTDPEEVDRG